jgi:hypothetical protein
VEFSAKNFVAEFSANKSFLILFVIEGFLVVKLSNNFPLYGAHSQKRYDIK